MRFFCKPPLMLVFLIKSYKEDAAAYSGIFAAYSKTVTLALPGTRLVEILSEISRVKDTSRYIVIGLSLRSLSYPAAFADTFPAGWRARRGRYSPVPLASKPSIPHSPLSSPDA